MTDGIRNASEVAAIRALQPSVLLGQQGGRDDVIALLQRFCAAGRGVEVGTFNGTFAGEILERTSVADLICVDPYRSYEGFNDSINTMDLQAIFEQAQRFLSGHPNRVRFIREFSQGAAVTIPDNSLDFVYVDGNHQSAFVTIDLNAWWSKLRPGGLMMGDDAVDQDDTTRNAEGDVKFVHKRSDDGREELFGYYGVYHAVRGFATTHHLDFLITGSQFILPKPRTPLS